MQIGGEGPHINGAGGHDPEPRRPGPFAPRDHHCAAATLAITAVVGVAFVAGIRWALGREPDFWSVLVGLLQPA